MKPASVALAVLLGNIVAAPAEAESSFPCENNFHVRLGQHITEVVDSCGEPDWTSQRIEKRKIRYSTGRRCACHDEEITEERVTEVLVDDLVYDFGVNHKARYLRFENGFLRSIISRWIASR
jgi:hypothetical protein